MGVIFKPAKIIKISLRKRIIFLFVFKSIFVTLHPTPVISTEAKRNGDLSEAKAFAKANKSPVLNEISRLHFVTLEMTWWGAVIPSTQCEETQKKILN